MSVHIECKSSRSRDLLVWTDHAAMRTAFNAVLKSRGENGRRFSGAEVRRTATGSVELAECLSEEITASRRVFIIIGHSQLSFRVSDDDRQLDMTAVDWSESNDPEGASSWCATLIEPGLQQVSVVFSILLTAKADKPII